MKSHLVFHGFALGDPKDLIGIHNEVRSWDGQITGDFRCGFQRCAFRNNFSIDDGDFAHAAARRWIAKDRDPLFWLWLRALSADLDDLRFGSVRLRSNRLVNTRRWSCGSRRCSVGGEHGSYKQKANPSVHSSTIDDSWPAIQWIFSAGLVMGGRLWQVKRMVDDIASLQKSLKIYKGLVEVGSMINSITDYDELLRAVLDVARRVMHAEAASLFLVNPQSNALELSIATKGEADYVEPNISVPHGKGIAGWVFAHNEALLIPDAYADDRFYKEADRQTGFVTRSILCAPLRFDGNVTGVLQVLNPREKLAFEHEDLEGFCAYADVTATALEKVRALERARARERVDRDLALASEIQSVLLSRAIPKQIAGAEFVAHNTPAANIGGDFYGVFVRSPDEIYFAIADVSGKGISAALLMAQTLSAMQFVFAATTGPAHALSLLNETLQARIIRGMFVTTLVGRLTPSTRLVELSSAGHCPPVRVGSDGSAFRIETRSSLPLGIMPGVNYQQTSLVLEPGDRLVAFTDGLTESRSQHDEHMFDDVLLNHVTGQAESSSQILDRLVAAELRHRGNGSQLDDLTILVGGLV